MHQDFSNLILVLAIKNVVYWPMKIPIFQYSELNK